MEVRRAAYRYMGMDVGFLAENLYLVGDALGLSVCAIAGFIDDGIEQLLGIDGQDEMALLLATVGVPADGGPLGQGRTSAPG